MSKVKRESRPSWRRTGVPSCCVRCIDVFNIAACSTCERCPYAALRQLISQAHIDRSSVEDAPAIRRALPGLLTTSSEL